MKIAMIGHKRIPSREGGIEIVVEELSTRMAAQGHTVHVYNRISKNVADQSKEKKKRLKEYKGVRLVWIPTINKKCLDALLYSIFATIRVLFGHYDVIHYHAEGPSAMLWLPHLFRKRIVVTIHGLDWQRAKWGRFGMRYLKFGEKMAAKYADEVIVLSNNIQKYFKDTYGRDTRYIPNGVNQPDIREAKIITEEYGLHKDDYILFLARLVPEKGLHYLLEAFKQTKTEKRLVIAGGTSHSNEYVEKIQSMATEDNRVIMTGFVQGRLLEELYSNCYLYVLPSDVEGMPISLLEAMSYGCRCLVSDIDENVEVVGEYGVSFKKSDDGALQRTLENIFSYKTTFDISKMISVNCINKYNWNSNVAATLNLFQKEINDTNLEVKF